MQFSVGSWRRILKLALGACIGLTLCWADPILRRIIIITFSLGFNNLRIFENSETMEEFNEEDIWGGVNDTETEQVGLQENGWTGVAVCRSMGIKEGNSNNSRRSVEIPWKESCHEENNGRRMRYQSSAPVNIPHWSQMVWTEKKNENSWKGSHGIVGDNTDDDDTRDSERNIPPHELIARQLAQTEIVSFSVFEGVGRTLKGRDLYRVRNAVWTRTGFIE